MQGDTGHATADMVVNTYSHMQDKTRTRIVELVEKDFYSEKTDKEVIHENITIESLMEILNINPDLKEKLLEKMNDMHDMQTLHEF